MYSYESCQAIDWLAFQDRWKWKYIANANIKSDEYRRVESLIIEVRREDLWALPSETNYAQHIVQWAWKKLKMAILETGEEEGEIFCGKMYNAKWWGCFRQ